MISALLLIKMDGWVTEQAKERIQSQNLSNAKQLIVGAIRDDVVVDVAANTAQDLHLALATFAQLPGPKCHGCQGGPIVLGVKAEPAKLQKSARRRIRINFED